MGTITTYDLSVYASLNFAVRGQKTPRLFRVPNPPADEIELEAKNINIQEISGMQTDLDEEGFQLHYHQSTTLNYNSISSQYDGAIRRYYREHELLLAQLLSVPNTLAFNHVYRDNGDPKQSGAIRRVHVDWTPKSAELVVRNRFEDSTAEKLLRERIRIFTIWRPLNGPTFDHPLALCHAQDVMPSDLIETDLVFENFVGQNYSVAYNPGARWYFCYGMMPHEFLIFKNYDSDADKAPYVPHSAFQMDVPEHAPQARKSLELRLIVFR